MIWAAMTLAFFGFLRLGEMTCNSPYSCTIHLSPGDVTFSPSFQNPEHMSVRIKISKTDPFRSGQTIVIGKTDQRVCPVLAMKNYLSYRGNTTGPLFKHLSGAPLTKAGLTSETRQLLSISGFQPSQYAGHSYRIGAATTSASVGLPPWLIKTLGRGGPLTATKDMFSANIPFFLGFLASCKVIPLISLLATYFKGWGCFVYGEYTSCICGDEVLPYRHSWPHRLTELMGCHGNHASKLPKD